MTDNTFTTMHDGTLTVISEERRRVKERMELMEQKLHLLTVPNAASRTEILALQAELGVNSMSAARGRLRTEHLRMKTHLERLDEREKEDAR